MLIPKTVFDTNEEKQNKRKRNFDRADVTVKDILRSA